MVVKRQKPSLSIRWMSEEDEIGTMLVDEVDGLVAGSSLPTVGYEGGAVTANWICVWRVLHHLLLGCDHGAVWKEVVKIRWVLW